jgi:hypothetical protein
MDHPEGASLQRADRVDFELAWWWNLLIDLSVSKICRWQIQLPISAHCTCPFIFPAKRRLA